MQWWTFEPARCATHHSHRASAEASLRPLPAGAVTYPLMSAPRTTPLATLADVEFDVLIQHCWISGNINPPIFRYFLFTLFWPARLVWQMFFERFKSLVSKSNSVN
jgi:hypothetical protein